MDKEKIIKQTVNYFPAKTSTVLGCLFVALKLMGYINWSWWLVTLPFWAGPVIGIVLLGALLAGFAVIAALVLWLESKGK